MSRPRVFRNPIHGQIKFKRVDLAAAAPTGTRPDGSIGWLIPRLINTSEFQRLRHIRQNGLTNLVFHGTEHSRFSHSMGVYHLASEMYNRILTNMDYSAEPEQELALAAASILHDVGHGPFSHAMEEVLSKLGTRFDHEHLSVRIIAEEDSQVNAQLRMIDPAFPAKLIPFINKIERSPDHWIYRLVSSQLDADRLDYSIRDAKQAGLRGHGYDMPRLLDMLHTLDDGIHIAVDRHATEAVEAYLLMLEHLYRAIYFHPVIRCATFLLGSVLRRAFTLHRDGDRSIFPTGGEQPHPLQLLVEQGEMISLSQYVRLGEYQVWSLIEEWQFSKDRILSDLATRLMQRKPFKFIEVDPRNASEIHRLTSYAERTTLSELTYVDSEALDLYVTIDEPSRTSYKRYDWRSETPDESIWLIGGSQKSVALENEEGNSIIDGLKRTNYLHRIIFPQEILGKVLDYASQTK